MNLLNIMFLILICAFFGRSSMGQPTEKSASQKTTAGENTAHPNPVSIPGSAPQSPEKNLTEKNPPQSPIQTKSIHLSPQRLSPKKQEVILMAVGEKKTILSPSFESISLSRPHIVKIIEGGDRFHLLARKKGSVFLNHGSQAKQIQVMDQKTAHLKLIRLIDQNPWLKWSFVEDKLHITGQLDFFETWQKLADVAEKNSIPYSMQAFVSPLAQKQALQFFKTKRPLSPFHIEWRPPVTVFSPRPIDLFSSYGMAVQKDENQKFIPDLVEVQVLLTEISSNFSKLIQVEGSTSIVSLSIEEIVSRLGYAQAKGEGNIIAKTKILIESGKEGRFLIGGEAPVHDYNLEKNSKSIRWKPYGISLRMTPFVYSKDRIQMNFSVEISDIDPAHSSEGSPATRNHRLSSQIHIPNGKTFRLSQLERRQWGKSISAPGFLSALPLAGSLFMQKGLSKETTKAFIFITPKIIQGGQKDFQTKGDFSSQILPKKAKPFKQHKIFPLTNKNLKESL